MIRILQANLHRSFLADNLLDQLARDRKADVILISEQYRNRVLPSWYSDPLSTAALWFLDNKKFRIQSHGSGPGFVWANVDDFGIFVSVYLTPNEEIRLFRGKVNAFEDFLLSSTGDIVVAGDFNARAVKWGMPFPDSR